MDLDKNKWKLDPVGKTTSNTQVAKGIVSSVGKDIADSIDRTPVPKLFMVLVIILYGIIANSKGELGVSNGDLLTLSLFLVIVCTLVFFLYIASLVFRDIKFSGFEGFQLFIKRCFYELFIISILILVLAVIIKNFQLIIPYVS